MRRIIKSKGAENATPSDKIFRYWVEIRSLRDNTARTLPLTAAIMIALVDPKKVPAIPNKRVLRLQDGSDTLEAKDLDDLARQLRERYPDGTYERTLHRERDHEAEQRRERAVEILARAVLEDLNRERSG